MARWYCSDCDLTMSISLREIHVNLPKHISNIPGLWDCVICEERLRAEDKASHIASDSHQQCLVKISVPQIKLTSLEGSSASLCVGGTELSSVRVNQTTSSPAPKSRKKPKRVKWKCTICNRKMDESSRLSHERGKPHLANLGVSAGRVTTTGTSILSTVLPPTSPTQSVSAIEPDPPAAAIDNPEPITDTPTTKATRVNQGAWTCTICSQSMHESSRAQHERGKRHRSRVGNPTVVAASSTSFSTTPSTKPKKTKSRKQAKKKKNTRPSPQKYSHDDPDDDSDDDSWDARGILRDIDTQWGLLPQGGAYKESNHYFGPGEWDYY